MDGKITRLVKDKKFGFIRCNQTKIDYFFHASSLMNANFNELKGQEEVTFVEVPSSKGPRAEKVVVSER